MENYYVPRGSSTARHPEGGRLLLEGRKKSHGSLMAIRVKELKDKTKEQSPCLELS